MSSATARDFAIGLMSVSLCGSAWASDLPESATRPAPVLASAPSFSVTGYVWATAIDGTSATLPPLPAADISLRFRDVLKELNGAFMASAEMRIDRWSFLVDGQFSQLTTGGTLPGPFSARLKLRSQSLTLQGSAFYRVHEDDVFALDVGGGVRFWNLNTKLEIASGLTSLRIDHSETQMWADPIVGARLGVELDGPWSLTVAGDIGGFGAGSRLTWQGLGSVNYAWSESLTLKVGYRALHIDYRDGGFLYDVTQHGPAVAATYQF
ncbi:hypothetical protein EZH22_04745 [Xanthobacter dioxanivorans]|uniref:Outer membrane protein beta-barrel domain-containing protein n=1 Tax=Xanthobacter dioxanivorans TaxID=2528964 RepID=A0A974PQP3_9HYPH|nr:hypothetical protein [Xanthobacter dioxanivorans]QRG07701.1 hypothetical protein EZH22_04745 [Xanthobacter dioxanivorans]